MMSKQECQETLAPVEIESGQVEDTNDDLKKSHPGKNKKTWLSQKISNFPIGKGWLVGITCAITGGFIMTFGDYAFGLYTTPIENEFGWSRTQINGAQSAGFMVANIIASPIVGRSMDTLGLPFTMRVCTSLCVAGVVLQTLTVSLPMWYMSYILVFMGFAGSSFMATGKAVALWFPDATQRTTVLTICSSFFNIVGMIMGEVGSHMIDAGNWRYFSGTLAICLVVMFALGIFLVKEPPKDKPESAPESSAPKEVELSPMYQDVEPGPTVRENDVHRMASLVLEPHSRRIESDSSSNLSGNDFNDMKKPLYPDANANVEEAPNCTDKVLGRSPAPDPKTGIHVMHALRMPAFWCVLVAQAAGYFSMYSMTNQIVPHLEAEGMPYKEASQAVVVQLVGAILAKFIWGTVAAKIGATRALSVNLVLHFIAAVGLIVTGSHWTAWVAVSFYGIVCFGLGLLWSLTALELFGVRSFGVIFGLLNSSGGFAGGVAPTMAGYCYDKTGHYLYAFGANAVVYLVGAVCGFMALRLRPSWDPQHYVKEETPSN